MKRHYMLIAAMLLMPVAMVMFAGCGKEEPKTPPKPETEKMKEAPPKEEMKEGEKKKEDAKTEETPAADIRQKTCPVMVGNPINPEIHVDHEGRRIYFCCAMCPPKFKADPEKYMPNVRAQLEGKTFEKPSGEEEHIH